MDRLLVLEVLAPTPAEVEQRRARLEVLASSAHKFITKHAQALPRTA